MDDWVKDYLGFVAAGIILSLVLLVLTMGIVFAIPAGIAFAIGYPVWRKHHGQEAKLKQAHAETLALYGRACANSAISEDAMRARLENALDDDRLVEVGLKLFADEGFLPVEPPPVEAGQIELASARDRLRKHIAAHGSKEHAENFIGELISILSRFDANTSGGTFEASRPRTNVEIEEFCQAFYGDHEYFKSLRRRLDQNLDAQKGVFPEDYKGDDCARAYLHGTPLMNLATVRTSAKWVDPENHTLVLAGSGAGKTTLFKHLIADLLRDDVCVIVMDSQSQVIEQLAGLDFDDDEIAWITPEHNLALNPFDADHSRLGDEAFVNNVIGQLEFVINKLLDAPMTPRQRTLFHHCTNLVMRIPGGTVDTFLQLLKDRDGFAQYIGQLDETGQRFFNEELKRDGRKLSPYDGTCTELSYRLDALLKNPTLRRIFNTRENRFSMFDEMQRRRLILIDTSLALLAEESATFGRFVIAQALQASYRRVKEKKTHRPVVFFVDEAHEYFDEKLETMLLQARKANVGMVIATQDMAKASRSGIADSLVGSTTSKFVSRVVPGDARRLAPTMKTTAEHLLSLPDHRFAFSSGGKPAVSIKANPDALNAFGRRSDLGDLRQHMIDTYGSTPNQNDDDDMDEYPEDFEDDDLDSTRDSEEEHQSPYEKPAMDDNEDQDIEPGRTL